MAFPPAEFAGGDKGQRGFVADADQLLGQMALAAGNVNEARARLGAAASTRSTEADAAPIVSAASQADVVLVSLFVRVRSGAGKIAVPEVARNAIEKLRAVGVEFVPISPNYYDDLVARLDIDQEQVERMRALGILYDRSPAGEYFHSYSRSFADRFFFEIVQRVGSYDAYGALNAPARMASQAQHAPTE